MLEKLRKTLGMSIDKIINRVIWFLLCTVKKSTSSFHALYKASSEKKVLNKFYRKEFFFFLFLVFDLCVSSHCLPIYSPPIMRP